MLLILMTYRISTKYKNISYWLITIFYYIYSFRYLSIYYESDTDEKNNVNNTSNEKSENEEMNNENKNVDEIAKNESNNNKDFETATKY